MIGRPLLVLARKPSSIMPPATPVENVIRTKITDALNPIALEVYNDSHMHSHHKAMVKNTSKETHFRVFIVSDAFTSQRQPARHRMVYALLKEEMAREGGIHALELRTRTLEEDEEAIRRQREAADVARDNMAIIP